MYLLISLITRACLAGQYRDQHSPERSLREVVYKQVVSFLLPKIQKQIQGGVDLYLEL